MNSVSSPAVFLFEKVSADRGLVVLTSVRIEAIREVDVPVPASSVANKIPVPMPLAAVPEAE